MKDVDQETLESDRPGVSAEDAVGYCLTRLYKSQAKSVTDEVCEGLTFEELIGALLLAGDELYP